MRLLYDIFFIIFSAFYIPILVFKGKFHKNFFERFGFLPQDIKSTKKPVWIHAVSVGEALVAVKLANAIKKRFPGAEILVSTTTRTGNEMALKKGKNVLDGVFYFPLDLSFIVKKVVRLVDPKLFLLIETELWPNLLEQLKLQGIPSMLINGRISDSSFSNYMKIKFITKRILNCLSAVCVQSDVDKIRVEKLGANEEKVFVTGNMKFDVEVPDKEKTFFTKQKLGISGSSTVFIAGSTHNPEEEMLIEVYESLRNKSIEVKFILAPRHIERKDAIRVYLEKSKLKYRCLSEIMALEGDHLKECDVILVDTIGHLKDLYSIGTVIFIGGSLVEKGGQNPIEAASWGKPVIFGPFMNNFRETADVFLTNDAAICVKDICQLEHALEKLFSDKLERENISEKAINVIRNNAGATNKTIDILSKYMAGKG